MFSQSTPEHIKESIHKFLKKLERLEKDRRYRKIESRQNAMKQLASNESDRLRREIGLKYNTDNTGIVQDLANSSSGSLATLSKYFGFYRDALKRVELTPTNSHEIEIGIRGERKLSRFHICHSIFKLSAIESQIRQDKQTLAIQAKRDPHSSAKTSLEIYDIENTIKTAHNLLTARSYLDKAIGIQVLTGRRSYEVVCTASFDIIDPNHVTFAGQAKAKTLPKESYEIPVLGGLAIEVCAALSQLRATKPELIGIENSVFNGRCQKDLNARIARHFASLMRLTEKGRLARVTSHNLRAAYGRIAFEEFGKKESYRESDMLTYLSRILGHAENDLISGQSYKYVKLPHEISDDRHPQCRTPTPPTRKISHHPP